MNTVLEPQSFTLGDHHARPPKPKSGYATAAERRQAKAKPAKIFYEPPTANEHELEFRHTHWKTKRARVREILAAAGTGRAQLESFDNCGADCYVFYCQEEKRYKVEACYCKNRHCQPCARQKANLMARNLREALTDASLHQFRFITLTLNHSDTPLLDQVKRLYASFKKLREAKAWKQSQKGGVTILEVTFNDKTRRWHVHLHIIAEGGFIQQSELSKQWLKATGDSRIVDIRSLKNPDDAAHYLVKYISKGTKDSVWDHPDAALEWVIAMKGVRTAGTFGSWRGFKLLKKPDDDLEWECIGSLAGIMKQANEGSVAHMGLIDVLRNGFQFNPSKPRHKTVPKSP